MRRSGAREVEVLVTKEDGQAESPRVLVIDNIDSFVYNIAQYLGMLGADVTTRRNHISLAEVERIDPDLIVLSPGPGRPEGAGVSPRIIERFPQTPILGVCLGHQAVGLVYGAQIVHAPFPVHGKASLIHHSGTGLYRGLESPFSAVRYHSLVISEEGLPPQLEVTSRTEDGLIMGIRHRDLPVEGVQFHPESVLTMGGKTMLSNFLEGIG
jgi:anthranilate synthase/aminodeoxychorismate synthase-like glutamine amidotransferase